MICHLFDQILAIFGHFWSILGRPGVREGSGEMADRPGREQLRSWQGLGRVRDRGLGRARGSDFGHFGPQGSKFEGWGSKFEGRGSKFEGRRSDFWSQGSKFEGQGLKFEGRRSDFWSQGGQNLRVRGLKFEGPGRFRPFWAP